MLKWRQMQAIVEKLAGVESAVIRPGDLDEPWRTIYERVGFSVDARTRERELWKATEGLEGPGGWASRVWWLSARRS